MPSESIIADGPPNDGREWDCQCARCGSSVDWQECEYCEDGYSHHDCGEDCCCCEFPEPNVVCDVCKGKAGWPRCMSSEEWCNAHPTAGRENVERGEIEWFTLEEPDDA